MDMILNPLVKKIGPAHFKAGMVVQMETINEVLLPARYYAESAARRAAREFVQHTVDLAKAEGREVVFNPLGEPYAKVMAKADEAQTEPAAVSDAATG